MNCSKRARVGNWMFAGSDNGGRTVAAHFSLTATCKLIGLGPYRYICMLYEELPKPSAKQNIDRLLPDRYLAENPDAKIVAR